MQNYLHALTQILLENPELAICTAMSDTSDVLVDRSVISIHRSTSTSLVPYDSVLTRMQSFALRVAVD